MQINTQVGQPSNTSLPQNSAPNLRSGNLGELIVDELHGRFYETNYKGNLFSFATTLTALTSLNATVTGLTATATPIIGVYNPTTSGVNLSVLQASVILTANNLTSGAAPGALVWVLATGASAISTGSTPYNNKTLTVASSQSKAFGMTTPLTGLVGSATIYGCVDLPNLTGLTYTTLGSTFLNQSVGGTVNVDGSFIVPPGAFLGIMNTVSSTTFSATSRIMWEEVPV